MKREGTDLSVVTKKSGKLNEKIINCVNPDASDSNVAKFVKAAIGLTKHEVKRIQRVNTSNVHLD